MLCTLLSPFCPHQLQTHDCGGGVDSDFVENVQTVFVENVQTVLLWRMSRRCFCGECLESRFVEDTVIACVR